MTLSRRPSDWTWPRLRPDAARPRRRGDRIKLAAAEAFGLARSVPAIDWLANTGFRGAADAKFSRGVGLSLNEPEIHHAEAGGRALVSQPRQDMAGADGGG